MCVAVQKAHKSYGECVAVCVAVQKAHKSYGECVAVCVAVQKAHKSYGECIAVCVAVQKAHKSYVECVNRTTLYLGKGNSDFSLNKCICQSSNNTSITLWSYIKSTFARGRPDV